MLEYDSPSPFRVVGRINYDALADRLEKLPEGREFLSPEQVGRAQSMAAIHEAIDDAHRDWALMDKIDGRLRMERR